MHRLLRKVKDHSLTAICLISALFGVIMLVGIIGEIFIQGLPSLTPYFLLTPESETPKMGQGIANAVVGSVFLSLLATVFATPISIGTAVYLQKYASDNRFTQMLRFFIEVLSGTPSIILGAFGLLVLVIYLHPFTGGFSLIAGSIGLAILILPVVERAIEDTIATIPRELEEGAYALGATRWEVITTIILPVCFSGIVTGIILGFGRAAEESAIVILTAGYSQFMPEFAIKTHDNLFLGIKLYPIQDVVGSLPYAVYHAYENSHVIPMSNAFACAFILISFVVIINVTAKTVLWFGSRKNKRGSSFLILIKELLRYNSLKEKSPKNFGLITKDFESSSTPPNWHAALTMPVRPASPDSSIESGENPHPLPPAKGRPGMYPEGRLYPDDATQCYPVTDPISGLPREHRVAPASCTALSDLFEDGPPREPVKEEYTAGPGGDVLLSEDLPLDLLCRHFLMEEQGEIPFRENWRNMTRNRQENTHV